MKLVSYICEECEKEQEEYFNDTEGQPEYLEDLCECGGKFRKMNFKRNSHRIYIMDDEL